MGKYFKKNMLLDDMFNFIDKHTYMITISSPNDINEYLTLRFCLFIIFMYKNKKIWLEPTAMKFIYNYLLYVISAGIVIETDKNRLIKDVKLYNAVYVHNYSNIDEHNDFSNEILSNEIFE